MLSQQQIDQFESDGFLDGGRVVGSRELEELRSELSRIIEQSRTGFLAGAPAPVTVRNLGNSPQPIVQVINIWQSSDAFRRLVFHPTIVSAISRLARSPDLIMFHDQVVYKPPMDGGVVQWHQDAPYWTVIEPTTPVSAWVALDDVDDDNGAMWMVPGSHRWGDAMSDLRKLVGVSNELKDPRQSGF